MKKILIILIMLLGVSIYAQDSTFMLESNKPKGPIVLIPDSVYNREASIQQNYYAWKEGKKFELSQTSEMQYSLYKRREVTKTRVLVFDNETNKIKEKVKLADFDFASDLVLIFLAAFVVVIALQQSVREFKSTSRSNWSKVLFFLFYIIIAILLYESYQVTTLFHFGFIIFISLAISYFGIDDIIRTKKGKRNYFIILSLLFLGIGVKFIDTIPIEMLVFCAFGFFLGFLIDHLLEKRRWHKKIIEKRSGF